MVDATLGSAPGAAAAPAKRSLPVSPRTLLAIGVAVVAAAGGAWWIAAPKSSVSTDDAYLQADTTTVAPRVRGFVSAVLVRDNQAVKAGDALARIDPEEFDARVAGAQADLATAEAAVSFARAALAALGDDEKLAQATIRTSETGIRSAQAQEARAAADRTRFDALAPTGAVTGQEVDVARAAAISAEQETQRTAASADVSRRQADVVRARRPGLEAALAQAQAAVLQRRAALDLARQDQGHTILRAPIDGVVGDRQGQVGDYVQPGAKVLTLVPLQALYVTANFKETQVSRMIVGQAATVSVDALPGKRLTGHVESFAPGSGSTFSLLPYEPGTGNFTKIVQRAGAHPPGPRPARPGSPPPRP